MGEVRMLQVLDPERIVSSSLMIFCQKFQMSDEPAPEPSPAPAPEPAPAPAPPPTITLQDIMNAVEVSQAREEEDKTKLEAIGTISFETLRASLLTWATRGFPNAYTIYEVALSAPGICSDGTSRALPEYIEFCSGKTIAEHVAVLQARLPDITVSFAYSGYSILIVVSRQA
jgi:hypothetical protein